MSQAFMEIPTPKSSRVNGLPFTKKSALKPLSRQFFTELAKLEADFRSQNYTLELLDELTECYSTAVEYYDALQDEISSYFLFKIQDTLAAKKSLSILTEEVTPKKDLKEIINEKYKHHNPLKSHRRAISFKMPIPENSFTRASSVEDSGEDEDRLTAEFGKRRLASITARKSERTLSKMKTLHEKQVTLFYKLEQERQNEEQSFNAAVVNFTNSSTKNDDLIIKDLENQKSQIRKRVELRKQESLSSFVLGNSFNSMNRSAPQPKFSLHGRIGAESARLEEMLTELDHSEDCVIVKQKSDGDTRTEAVEKKETSDLIERTHSSYLKEKSSLANSNGDEGSFRHQAQQTGGGIDGIGLSEESLTGEGEVDQNQSPNGPAESYFPKDILEALKSPQAASKIKIEFNNKGNATQSCVQERRECK